MSRILIPANYYQQFDGDFNLEVPAEGYGGWKKEPVPIAPEHTALAAMHVWDTGTKEEYPGWYRCAEYLARSPRIIREVFPPLLGAVRNSPLKIIHIISGVPGDKFREYPGYNKTLELAGNEPEHVERVDSDPVVEELRRFRKDNIIPGAHNMEDVQRGSAAKDFPKEVRPLDNEYIAENERQIFAICKKNGINHLIYAGFAINWCLLMSPGSMLEMKRHGLMCSTIRQAVTAVENKETARGEICKELALWRVALEFGFVFDLDDFINGLKQAPAAT